MASEFDEALQGFLQSQNLELSVVSIDGVFFVNLFTRGRRDVLSTRHARAWVAKGEGTSLDGAINAAVEAFDGSPTGGAAGAEDDGESELEPNLRWSTKYKNSLPDSAFLWVREDCVEYKDQQGRSHPLSCRDLPVKNRSGAYDYAHVKNAISRAVQLVGVPAETQRRLQAEARKIFEREFGYA